jgi:glutamine synthetase
MFSSAEELLAYVKDEGIAFIDVRFCDLPGIMQHFTVPVSSFGPAVFEDGLQFDGSSIRGFQQIHESDMSLLPDPTTAYLDPFRRDKTLIVNFFVHDPLTGEAYSRDPRNIARKAQEYLKSTGIADTAFFAPEAEFYVFDDVRFETQAERELLPHRLRRRRLEHRPGRGGRQPRVTRSGTRAVTSPPRRSTTSPTCATTITKHLEAAA